MLELNISPDFTIEDIRKIRRYNYEVTKNMAPKERWAYYEESAEKARKRMRELKKASKK